MYSSLCCVEVLWPSQPNGVMSSAVSFPRHTLLAKLSPLSIYQYCAHFFARNRQLPFLNQRKGENIRRKYFIIKSPRKNVADLGGGQTRDLLASSRTCIQLSHRGQTMYSSSNVRITMARSIGVQIVRVNMVGTILPDTKVLTVTGSSRGVSISACFRNTLPRQTRHNILSNAGILSRSITPATNLYQKSYTTDSPYLELAYLE